MSLPVDHPVLVAPLGGGPTTPELVVAAARAGSLGFLAAGYKSPEAVEAELREVGAGPYGLNVFVPAWPAPDVAELERYRAELQPEADRYGIDLPPLRLDDDDAFGAKVELAVDAAPPLVSFTFGAPPAEAVKRLRAVGTQVLVTVTDLDEARAALAAGADGLVVQGGEGGAHASTTEPGAYTGERRAVELVKEVRALTERPLIAAGGVGTAADVAALLDAGAAAVQAGTRFVAAAEANARPTHLEALLEGGRETVVTRAFTGQPARALRNRFTDEHSASAPVGYPAIHHLTTPIRAAAAERGDPEGLHLWAGTRYEHLRPGTTEEILEELHPG